MAESSGRGTMAPNGNRTEIVEVGAHLEAKAHETERQRKGQSDGRPNQQGPE